jgi:uncharacterized protein (DUF302 family)
LISLDHDCTSGIYSPQYSNKFPAGGVANITAWSCAMADNGLVTIPSIHGVRKTIDRLEADVKAKGMTVFARIDHAAGASGAGLTLRPTELLIFGNAKAGTALMQAGQTIGIDLPLKVLGWEDAGGKVWLSYNDPVWLAERHGLAAETDAAAKAMAAGLAALSKHAAGG